jgi:putative ATP-dependent endonuclease of OLD family
MPKTKKATEAAVVDPNSIPENVSCKLRKLIIRNFCCIGKSPVEIDLDDIVVLVGPNNVGKSTVLRAYQVITQSSAPKLTIEDFHQKIIDGSYAPSIELHTAVVENLPGNKWVQDIGGENIVRERWTWKAPDEEAKREGWDCTTGAWSDKVPWGAANVANSRRPKPHRIEAFADPEEQVAEITKMLVKELQNRIKGRSVDKTDAQGQVILGADGKPEKTDFGKLIESLAATQKTVVQEAKNEIANVETQLSTFISGVFPGYEVKFDAKPEEDLLSGLSFFKAGTALQIGPSGGHLSNAERQGSGARRTLMWAALRFIAETTKKNEDGPGHLLLLDEPELCLHPNAIREACATLYKLPETKKWQVMVTTHSPVFIDLSRDNTTVVRVERDSKGDVQGTTVFRPSKVKLAPEEKSELKLLNIYDAQVAEFFFGGRTVLVEGDTEFTAFRYVISQEADPNLFKDVNIIRARGKVTLALLARILNQFGARYAVLHDADAPEITTKKGKVMVNPAWTNNQKILDEVQKAPDKSAVRLVASLPNFEGAMFKDEAYEEKPYNAYTTLKEDSTAFAKVKEFLVSLIDFTKPVPDTSCNWDHLDKLKEAVKKVI